MKYNDLISVNDTFQYSVNLQFDINDISKIKEYIPTKDGCELLQSYYNSIVKGKNRATTLIGPYGKGKSHLLLVLITLLADYDEQDTKHINEFLEKIKRVDKELYDIISKVRKDKLKLMPVIINSNYGDLNQAFLLALSEALEREKLSEVVVNTYFDVALKVVSKWEETYKDMQVALDVCLNDNECTLKELKQGLKIYSEKHYQIFKNVYSCILHGQEFNPLVNSDIVKTYKDIAHELTNYGFNGMFIVFDEFSKFLEYVDNSHMMKDLKLLQDFAELANRTSLTEQIHLCCITHKTINQYSYNLSEDKLNALKTVEGRFKETYFNRSLEQNYEIVSYALKKQDKFDEFFAKYYLESKEQYEEIKNNLAFKNVENIEKVLFKGCFPLNPITVYALIQLSEKIAQNERTLFTFLTDDDTNSLKSFIQNDEQGLFNIDKIYDYFKLILKKELDEHIKDIYLKSQNAINKAKSQMEIRIIKAISVIYMINETELLVPNDATIRTALSLTEAEYGTVINDLIEKSIIKRKKITNELDFATVYNRETSKEIKKIADLQFSELNVKEALNSFTNMGYSLPRRYNDEYKITRFFANVFMSEKELLNMNSLDILLDNRYCDGIIINLIRESKNTQEIREHFEKINNDRIVLRIPKMLFPKNIVALLKEYKAIEYLLDSTQDKDEIISELEIIKKETADVLNEQVLNYFAHDNIQEYLYRDEAHKKVNNVSSFISNICFDIYSKTPVVNNEMINKKELTAPIKKAREFVLQAILNNDRSLIKSKTSAEATIYKAIVEKSQTQSIKQVIDIINKFIAKSENNKLNFSEIYKKLESKPYGTRKGIMPILIAMALYNYSDIIVIYYMNKEIDLDVNNLIKINENPEKYYILTEKGSADKIKYLSNLMYLYDIPNIDIPRINLKKLVDVMRRWILSLPRILREYNVQDDSLNIKQEYIQIKSELLRPDINNNEFIYKRLPEIFNTDNFSEIIQEISNMKKAFDEFIEKYSQILIEKTKNVLNKNFKGSLTSLLREWYNNNNLQTSITVYDLKTRQFIEYAKNLATHDENDVIEKIAKIVTNYYIEDWQAGDLENYLTQLQQIVDGISTKNKEQINVGEVNRILLINGQEKIEKHISDSKEISAIGTTMKSNIEELIEEYGESLTEQEKISILVDIIKKYI